MTYSEVENTERYMNMNKHKNIRTGEQMFCYKAIFNPSNTHHFIRLDLSVHYVDKLNESLSQLISKCLTSGTTCPSNAL